MTTSTGGIPRRRWTAKWSPLKATLVATAFAVPFSLAFLFIGAHWRIGFDPQARRCLPYRAYLLETHKPEQVERGRIYYYLTEGAAPTPDGTRAVKIVAGVAGDRVVVDERGVWVNGDLWGPLNERVLARASKSPASVRADYVLADRQVLMLGTSENSWDGRYWGPLGTHRILGEARPLW